MRHHDAPQLPHAAAAWKVLLQAAEDTVWIPLELCRACTCDPEHHSPQPPSHHAPDNRPRCRKSHPPGSRSPTMPKAAIAIAADATLHRLLPTLLTTTKLPRQRSLRPSETASGCHLRSRRVPLVISRFTSPRLNRRPTTREGTPIPTYTERMCCTYSL